MKSTRNEIELAEAKAALTQMEADPAFITHSAYRANADIWPDNRISFIDTHMSYLQAHPQLSTKDYLSNLRLKLRKSTVRKS